MRNEAAILGLFGDLRHFGGSDRSGTGRIRLSRVPAGYGPASYNECSYTSIAQCNATASGRAAECYPNAFAAAPPAGRPYRRHY